MKSIEHHGYFKDGRWHFETFKEALRALQGRPVVLTVHEFKEKRTSPQNRYYYGPVLKCVGQGLKDAGWDPIKCTKEACHDMMAREFLTVDEHLKDGVFLRRTRSTTELDVTEFGEYLEHIIQFAAEYLNVIIPQPGEQQEMEYENAA